MLLAKGLTLDLAVQRLLDLIPLLAVAFFGTAILEIVVYLFFKKVLRSRFTLPYTLVAPAAVALLLFTLYPFVYNVRLAFSDLRLKTISCYIPNTTVTSAACSLGQAAPNVDVTIKIDEYPAHVEPNETAPVAFTVKQGEQVRVTGKSSKIVGYIIDTGTAMKINDAGTGLTSETCPAPIVPGGKECRDQYTQFKANVIDVQDQRFWWPIKTSDGQTGWIPNQVYFITEDGNLYSEAYGNAEVVGTVQKGQMVRQISSSRSNWYEVSINDQTGWVNADLVTSDQSFFPAADGTVYKDMNTSSDTVGTVTAGQETGLLETETMTWYQVFVSQDQIGWVNTPVVSLNIIQTFTAAADTTLYQDMNTDSPQVGSIAAGDEVVLVLTDNTTDVTWYQVRTADGTVGWVTGITPTNLVDHEVFTLKEDRMLYEEANSDSVAMGTVAAGTTVRLVERNQDNDVTWHRIRLPDNSTGWVNVDGEVATNYAVTADTQVYSEIGGMGDTLADLTANQPVNVTNDTAKSYTRYEVRLEDGTVGWATHKPDETVTTERNTVLYSLKYGWDNFKRVFVKTNPQTGNVEGWGRLLQTQNSTFPRLMRTTLAWTSLNVVFHLIFGMILAMMLNRPGLKLRGIYRAIIILPWAIPQPIIALAWKGEFNYQFGFVNALLQHIGLNPVNWLYTPTPAFIAVTFVNIWLGIPFYMVTLLGGLQSIAGEYYEAAEIDGANAWQRFRNVTVPLIRPVAVPIVTLDVIWTFNNFNVIYLITKGEPNESTNILVTALYNAAFGENGQFQLGFAAAFSLIIFAVLFLFASFWVTSSGALKGVYES